MLFADKTESYFPYELIFSCCSDDLKAYESIESLVSDSSGDFYADNVRYLAQILKGIKRRPSFWSKVLLEA